jgi:hypothetical protein
LGATCGRHVDWYKKEWELKFFLPRVQRADALFSVSELIQRQTKTLYLISDSTHLSPLKATTTSVIEGAEL